jgi:pimeloyl-ACP methyl ester carboxylesterase
MSTFILIHGAWHGSWCWRKVVPLLESRGHAVVAPLLPGHGDDGTPAPDVTLETYAAHVCDVLATQSEPVVLVGHSMGGGVITQAAEWCPSRIRVLVYVAAYMPGDGSSIADQALEDEESLVNKYIQADHANGHALLDTGIVRECFYHDCSDEDVRFAKANLCPNPLAPLTSPLALSPERSGGVPRVYVECLQDRTITLDLQRRVQSLGRFEATYSLDTSHSPFFSAPESLVECLLNADTIVPLRS